MKQATALLFLILAFICVVFGSFRSGGVASAQSSQVCPSPAPSCSTKGTLTDLDGAYACSQVETDSSNTVGVGILLFTSTGTGKGTAVLANNDNSMSTTTYQDFFTLTDITYCVNSNDTGYLFLPEGSGCPMAFIIDNGNGAAHSEVRLLWSTQNTAGLATCKKQ